VDEFESIARLFRPLTRGAPEALNLQDDAAAIPSRPGFDLIVTKDAMVEGVHFLAGDPPDLIARKLLRVNLSDLAAKGASPYGYFLAVAWSQGWDSAAKTLFTSGLAEDQAAFGLTLLGGDTVWTPGPFTLSATMLGWTPSGAMVRRDGAVAGDLILVSGTIGDGWLGLASARIAASDDPDTAYLAGRYRLPEPRLGLQTVLRAHASAAADVSDGLLADAGHIGEASGLAVHIDLERLPLSPAAGRWLETEADRGAALAALAAGGDDYEIVMTVSPAQASLALAHAVDGPPLSIIGQMRSGSGVHPLYEGRPIRAMQRGWMHR
jgi:thiamine-monophosphate kinase